jgi:hypothetical protein
MKFIKENWFKIIVVCALFIITLSAVYYLVIFSSIKNKQLVSDIDLQTKCANEANLYLDKVKGQYSVDYQSHWNKQQNKCFIKISSSYPDNPPISSFGNGVELDDAIEGVYYGSLITDMSGIKVCMYGKSDGDGHGMQKCSTNEQFDTYMANIMGN